jgi:hypothetical protein
MNSSPNESVDWSDFSRRKIRAVIGIFCIFIGGFLLMIGIGLHNYLAIPIGIAGLVTGFVFLRQLQVVVCPYCGKPFMDQDENLLISRSAGWSVLFNSKCFSCGQER